tara:strand:- start:1119 stop:1376 length:258 start_codon:yes stop_codon:yes gene_type:complete
MKLRLNHILVKVPLILIIIGLILPMIMARFATPQERKPDRCVSELPFKSQLMHMMVVKNKIKFSSSILIGIISFIAVYIAINIKL